jgi:hypothetical protein
MYYENSYLTVAKSFITLAPDAIKYFSVGIHQTSYEHSEVRSALATNLSPKTT